MMCFYGNMDMMNPNSEGIYNLNPMCNVDCLPTIEYKCDIISYIWNLQNRTQENFTERERVAIYHKDTCLAFVWCFFFWFYINYSPFWELDYSETSPTWLAKCYGCQKLFDVVYKIPWYFVNVSQRAVFLPFGPVSYTCLL